MAKYMFFNDDEDGTIKDGALNVTRVTWIGGGAVAVLSPVLANVVAQDNIPLQWMATVLGVASIVVIGLVSAADIIGRAWATSKEGAATPGSGADDENAGGPAGADEARTVSIAAPINVKVSGRGDTIFQAVAIRWDPGKKTWQYLVAGGQSIEWVDESEVDQFVPDKK